MSRIEKSRNRPHTQQESIPAAEAVVPDLSRAGEPPLVPVYLRDPRDEDRLKMKRDKQRSYDRRRRESAVHMGDTRLTYRGVFYGGLLDIRQPMLFMQRPYALPDRRKNLLTEKSTLTLAAPDFSVEIDLDLELAQRAQQPPHSGPFDAEKRRAHALSVESSRIECERVMHTIESMQAEAYELAKDVAKRQVDEQMLLMRRSKEASPKASANDGDMLQAIRKKYANLNVKLELPKRQYRAMDHSEAALTASRSQAASDVRPLTPVSAAPAAPAPMPRACDARLQKQAAYGVPRAEQFTQPRLAQSQCAQSQYAPKHAQTQYAQSQYAQSQYAQPQYAQPQYAQQKFEPKYVPQFQQPQYAQFLEQPLESDPQFREILDAQYLLQYPWPEASHQTALPVELPNGDDLTLFEGYF